MKSIAFAIPYFGKLPNGFQVWLNSCKYNPSITWFLYTDDMTSFSYPENVIRIQTSFQLLKEKVQELYDFPILIDRPWKLCDYKVAYGEIFSNELKNFDFWGFCDIDLIWGNLRKFYTDELLDVYDKIGFQGHATIVKNTIENNRIYRLQFDDCVSYQEVFSRSEGYCFDEWIYSKMFKNAGKKVYEEVNFAHLQKYSSNYFLLHLPYAQAYKNRHQIFEWNTNGVFRHYVFESTIKTEEFMYLHFWCRPTSYKIKDDNANQLMIYPDIVTDKQYVIDKKTVKSLGAKRPIRFLIKMLWRSRKKITIKRIFDNINSMIKLKKYSKSI